ncbi:MAG TPA: NUDIX hydrolase [Cyclobacteriaceae bacterium]
MDSIRKNLWKTILIKEVYENSWIKLDEHQVINPSGGKGIYGKVHFKNKAIGIIPLDKENNTWIVGQHRYTLNEWSWEIPEGGGPLEIDTLTSAKRELSEETGLIAKKWTEIARVHLSNSVSNEVGYVFLAEELAQGNTKLDDTEADMIVKKLPYAEVLQMVEHGEITDSLSVIGVLRLARLKGF